MFKPRYRITPKIAGAQMRIELAKEAIRYLPITPSVLASLRETARLFSTHSSTMIEGNRLSREQVQRCWGKGRISRAEKVTRKKCWDIAPRCRRLSSWRWVEFGSPIPTFKSCMPWSWAVEKPRCARPHTATYREGQNVIRDGRSGGIIYMPPMAKDVPPHGGSILRSALITLH